MDCLVSTEIRNRIRLAIFAYAYEVHNESLILDSEYDALSLKIDKTIITGDKVTDKFFKTEFNPSTGLWIHKHPKLDGIKNIYFRVFKNENIQL